MKTVNDHHEIVDDVKQSVINYTTVTINKRYITNLPSDRIVATLNNGVKIPFEYVPTYGALKGIYIVTSIDVPYDKRFNHEVYINPTNAFVKNIDIKEILTFKFSKQYPTNDLVEYDTFISEEELAVNGDMFLQNENILVSYNIIDSPFPEQGLDHITNETGIEYIIYGPTVKTYYLKVANSIKPLISQQGVLRDGLYIFFTINDVKKKIYYPLDEISTGGVYTNRHDAMTNGNLEETLELIRLDSEIKLLEMQVSTKKELMKLSVIKAEAEADIKISLAKQQQDIADRKAVLENRTLDKKNLGFGLDIVNSLFSIGSKFL